MHLWRLTLNNFDPSSLRPILYMNKAIIFVVLVRWWSSLVVAAMEKKSERKLLKRKVGHWCKRKENIYTLEANIQQILIYQRWLKKQQMLLIFKQPALRRASLSINGTASRRGKSSNLLLKSFPASQPLSFSIMISWCLGNF